MYNLFNSSRGSLVGRFGDRPAHSRNSSDRLLLRPMGDDEGLDERRYYRSADFQRALLEEQIQQSLTAPASEPTPNHARRHSRHRLSRMSTTLSKSSLSSILDIQKEPKEQDQQPERSSEEVQSPAVDDAPSPEDSSPTSVESSEEERVEAEKRFHVPKIQLDGIGPFARFAKSNRKDK